MKIAYVVVLLILCLILYMIPNNKIENMEGMSSLSNEAIQGIASIYNNDKLIVTNANISGNLNVGNTTISGKLTTAPIDVSDRVNLTSPNVSSLSGYKMTRTDEDGVLHEWASYHTPKSYGQNDYQIWEYKMGSDGKNCGSVAGGVCSPRFIISQGGNVKIPGSLNVNGNVNVYGNMIRSAPIYRKHDVAGYFGIYAYGFRIPLYYGWNMLWPDHDRSMNLRKHTSAPVSYQNIDMRNAGNGDKNWTPRFLTVYPGYIARFYYWDVKSTDSDIYNSGEYDWTGGSPGGGLKVHLIYISLVEEGPYGNTSQPSVLTG